jgi:hypothetical protein
VPLNFCQEQVAEAPAADTDEGADTETALDQELAQLLDSVAQARVKHRTLHRVQRMYEKRLPALHSDAARLAAISKSMVQATSSTTGASTGTGTPSTSPSLSELTTQAAEAVVLCSRLSAAAADGTSDQSATSKSTSLQGGRSRQSFGGVMSQFERDVKEMGGGRRST